MWVGGDGADFFCDLRLISTFVDSSTSKSVSCLTVVRIVVELLCLTVLNALIQASICFNSFFLQLHPSVQGRLALRHEYLALVQPVWHPHNTNSSNSLGAGCIVGPCRQVWLGNQCTYPNHTLIICSQDVLSQCILCWKRLKTLRCL